MSSTSKTANLKLNQWGALDTPQMADLNADNAKIDAAYGNIIAGAASPLVKLVDVHFSAGSNSFTQDVSGINFDNYLELIFCLEISQGSGIEMWFNDITNQYNLITPKASVIMEHLTLGVGVSRLSISRSVMNLFSDRFLQVASMRRSTIPKVNTINLHNYSNYFSSGDQLTIWGLRR